MPGALPPALCEPPGLVFLARLGLDFLDDDARSSNRGGSLDDAPGLCRAANLDEPARRLGHKDDNDPLQGRRRSTEPNHPSPACLLGSIGGKGPADDIGDHLA